MGYRPSAPRALPKVAHALQHYGKDGAASEIACVFKCAAGADRPAPYAHCVTVTVIGAKATRLITQYLVSPTAQTSVVR